MAKLDQGWTVEAHHAGSALAAELHRHMGLSHRQAKGLIDARCVTVNGEVATKHGQRMETGDKLAVAYDPELKYDPIPSPKGALDNSFKTLWEDTHLLFVDKPAGLLTVPAEQGGEASLADAVADHYRRRGQKHAQLYIVHRLDRFTSGVLVFARTPEALHHLKKLFALHKLQRTYKAILVGELPENQGTLKGHLIEHAKTLKMRVVDPKRREAEGSQSAVTHYRVVERLPGHTVVEVELETGRRNQIRVQFADRGFPLLGDHVYGEESPLLDRQALHAETLGVRHPVTEAMITVTAPPPADFEAALKALRARTRLQRAAAGEKGELEQPKPARKPLDRAESRGPKDRRPGEKPRFQKGAERPGKKPFRPRAEDGERPRKRFEDREERPRGPRRETSDRPRAPRAEGSDRPRPKRFEDREERPRAPRREGAGDRPRPKRFEDREDRPRREASERPRPKRAEDRDERPRAPRREGPSDRPRPKRFEDREEGPRGAKPAFRKPAPRRDEGERPRRPEGARPRRSEDGPREERPRRTFDKGPREGAPARPRAPRGAVTGPRGSGGPGPGGARPRPGGSKPKTGAKPGGPRKPFVKKRS